MSPNCYIIAGPNGAGKTTFAREFLPYYTDCKEFLNADLIAQGISPFVPESVAIRAGRLMLEEIASRVEKRVDFGFETTLSGHGHLKVIRRLKEHGYTVTLYYLWVPAPEISLLRIKERVEGGGHDVPEPDVRRRYERSIRNFLLYYRQVVDSWTLFDNSSRTPVEIALENHGKLDIIHIDLYKTIVASYGRP